MKAIVKLFNPDPWEVRKTIWPYPDGWTAYNTKTKTFVDIFKTKEEAIEECKKLNN